MRESFILKDYSKIKFPLKGQNQGEIYMRHHIQQQH